MSLMTTGCGVVAQYASGWDSTQSRQIRATHSLTVTSEPEGANVVADGAVLGTTPLEVPVEYAVRETVTTPHFWTMLGTGIAEVAAGLALGIAGAHVANSSDGGVPMMAIGFGLVPFGAIDLIWGWTRGVTEPEVTRSGPTTVDVEYTIEKDGEVKRLAGTVPGRDVLSVRLAPPPLPPSEHIVAVMDVGSSTNTIAGVFVRDLTDQLRVFISQSGVRTIDRGAQLQEMKIASYDDCYDEACQIELGKALAASHIVRSSVRQFGGRCVLNGELVDLVREVTVRAATAQGDCQAEGFLEMSATLAKALAVTVER